MRCDKSLNRYYQQIIHPGHGPGVLPSAQCTLLICCAGASNNNPKISRFLRHSWGPTDHQPLFLTMKLNELHVHAKLIHGPENTRPSVPVTLRVSSNRLRKRDDPQTHISVQDTCHVTREKKSLPNPLARRPDAQNLHHAATSWPTSSNPPPGRAGTACRRQGPRQRPGFLLS
jgi:hypothetical protein